MHLRILVKGKLSITHECGVGKRKLIYTNTAFVGLQDVGKDEDTLLVAPNFLKWQSPEDKDF